MLKTMNLLVPTTIAFLLAANAAGIAADSGPGNDAVSSGRVEDATSAELKKIEAADDLAQAEVERWQRENKEQKAKGKGVEDSELQKRIDKRLTPVRQAYDDFLKHHPESARGHLLYGSFLNDNGEERAAQGQWEKALALDPANSAVYNNLAGRYTESGPVNKAFEYFAKAIELSPTEPVYYHNFGDSLFVLRKQAGAYYGISEQQVYAKVLLMYSNALQLDPRNFSFARDLAQTYYSIKPLPTEAALAAWTNAQLVASEEADKQDASVHLARIKMLAGRFAEARSHLDGVTNEIWSKAKAALLSNLAEREKQDGKADNKADR